MTRPLIAGRRLWPRRMRSRLAVMYTVLIFLAGVSLLGVTYVLVANVLLPARAPVPTTKTISQRDLDVLRRCKPLPTSSALLAECKRVIAATGGNDQRDSALHALQGASVI